MATPLGTFLRHFRRAREVTETAGLSDALLLERFVRDREEVAFEVLLWRHAPLVLGVCRRLLRDEQETEDAFQATFIVLLRKAASISRREALGSWLYKVAYRIALRSRARSSRRAREMDRDVEHLPAAGKAPDAAAEELRLALDEEISRLPALYRSAVVLCYLEGHTQEAAARQLGCAPGTVAWRLSQACTRLRARLSRRGLGSHVGPLAAGSSPPLLAAPSLPLIENTVNVALAFARGQAVPCSAAALAEGAILTMTVNKVKRAVALLLVASLLGAGSVLLGWATPPGPPAAPARAELVGDRLSLRLPVEEVTRLGVRIVAARPREAPPRRLVLPGSLAIPPGRLASVRIRFAPAEVIRLGAKKVGDTVKKGEVLAVLRSKDVSEKKSDLLDALVKLALDKEILARAEKAKEAVPEVFLLTARRNVVADERAVHRARHTLLPWGIGEADVKAVEAEALRISAAKGKRDPDKEKAVMETWGRVEVRAPLAGVVIEQNVGVGEVVTDATVSLFRIADLRTLNVVVAVAEDDLPGIMALQARHRPGPIPWQVRLGGDREHEALKSEGLEQISYLIDPENHTCTAIGQVDNASGALRPGQFVRATLLLPARPREIVVPTSALVESGGSTIVFVQADAKQAVFAQRRVVVVRRGRDTARVRLHRGGGAETGGQPLRAGERVVTEGALELKAALDDLRGEEP